MFIEKYAGNRHSNWTNMNIKIIFRKIFSKEEQEQLSRLNQVGLFISFFSNFSYLISCIRYVNAKNWVL